MRSKPNDPMPQAASPGEDSPARAQALRGFGRRLGDTRRDRGLTQVALAAQLGLSASSLRRYEAGVNFPPLPVLLALRRALRVSLDFLLAGTRGAAVRHLELARRLQELDELPGAVVDAFVPLADAFLRTHRPGSPVAARRPTS